ncbi:hypothetical protein H4582DRAFT_2063756 [Lactarius indigo]|nr:hypothetical protein H4582DRAFT_2063756 [Lactarius indigo]
MTSCLSAPLSAPLIARHYSSLSQERILGSSVVEHLFSTPSQPPVSAYVVTSLLSDRCVMGLGCGMFQIEYNQVVIGDNPYRTDWMVKLRSEGMGKNMGNIVGLSVERREWKDER